MTFPDGTSGPPAADDPPTTRLTPIRPDTGPPPTPSNSVYGSPAAGAYGPAAGAAYGPPPPAARPPRRRGLRTALLLAAAVLAGTLGGVTYGYAEQAGEPPTPLPPLNQPGLAHPEKPLPDAEAPEPLSAAQDRRVKTDGDLRELLVSKPAGTVDAETDIGGSGEGWLAPYEVVADTGAPGDMLGFMLEKGLRRTAFTSWRKEGGFDSVVMINLFQFRNDATAGSVDYLAEQQMIASIGMTGGEVPSVSLKGSANGRAYFLEEPYEEAGVPPLYQGTAVARRGDIVMEIYLIESSPIEEKDLTKLAERQLERL
ncbi:hypothetical protein [Streptomyces sp. 184]|uniref:hypothetical protein n=1 Tax=Streptomyces sp. 184 TaxID=1827526 RepID=UPI003891519E